MVDTRISTAERAARVRFRRAIALMMMTLVLPGSAQLVAGNARVGRIALRIWFGLLLLAAGLVVVSLVDNDFAVHSATDPTRLQLLRLVLTGLAVGWAYLFLDAWRIGQPLSLLLPHRRAVLGINGVLCLSVAGALLFSAHTVGVVRGALVSMSSSGDASDATDGRYNVLLLGGDAGAGRTGLRPDSLTVASIDAETGRTVLVGLPRNMSSFPFPEGSIMAEQFPQGWDCDDCYLNALATWATDHEQLFQGHENPGVEATIEGVEGITGLDISYWAMVDLRGFRELVDAVGGVTLNVRDRIPVGLPHDDFYTHIEPGVQKLDGFETLWFARARYDSDDYSRMARQKCVMGAMLEQLSPTDVLTRFSDLAKAGSAMVSTSIPSGEVGRFVSLALKAKSQKISTVSLVPPAISTGNPDIDKVHRMVQRAIDRAEGKKTGKRKDAEDRGEKTEKASSEQPDDGGSDVESVEPADVTGGSIGSLRDGYAANEAEDLSAAC